MSLTDRVYSGYKDKAAAVSDFIRSDDKKDRLKEAIFRPKFIPERHWEAKRAEQWLAAALLSFIVPASLAIIVAIDQTFTQFLLNGDISLGNQSAILSFVVNMLGIMLVCLAAWSWFMWVRTGGFRLFEM